MKILITGSNGFIGQRLAVKLVSEGVIVFGMDRDKRSLSKNFTRYFSGDVLNKQAVERAMKGVDGVIHLAALTSHQEIVDNKFKTLETNFLGTKNVLDVFIKSKSAKKFIYSSTGKVYGNIKFNPITEEHPTLPLNTLGKSKLITERMIDFYADDKKTFIIFRIFNIFGPGQKDNFLVPTILNQLKKTNTITLGDIKSKRDYVYVEDLLDAFNLVIKKNLGNGLYVFNICSGKGTSAEKIAFTIGKIKKTQIKIKIDRSLFRKDEKKNEYGSLYKTQKILGWHPKYSLKKGLKETIDFMQK